MSVNKLEALFDAIASAKKWSDPESDAYQLRNPLLVKSFSKPGKNNIDSEGRRVFGSALSGIRACLFDLEIKVKGESRAGLRKDDHLGNLLRVFGIREQMEQLRVVSFLKHALMTPSISRTTPLSFFLENK